MIFAARAGGIFRRYVHRAHDFPRKPLPWGKGRHLRRQTKDDFQPDIRLQKIFRLKQQTGAGLVSGFPVVHFSSFEAAVFQRQLS